MLEGGHPSAKPPPPPGRKFTLERKREETKDEERCTDKVFVTVSTLCGAVHSEKKACVQSLETVQVRNVANISV